MDNKQQHFFEDFTKRYAVNKTLRFRLEPIGDTATHIKQHDILSEDEKLAQLYKQAKQIIDEYHKWYIDDRLSQVELDIKVMEAVRGTLVALKARRTHTDNADNHAKQMQRNINELKSLQDTLREQVTDAFKGHDKHLFDKSFIRDTLPVWLAENQPSLPDIADSAKVIATFHNWTTYFGGFNKNRENIYTKEAKSTAIAYRIVHDNLPRFIANIDRYHKAKQLGVDFSAIASTSQIDLDECFSLASFNKCLTQSGIEQYNRIIGGETTAQAPKNQGINEYINLHAQSLSDTKQIRATRSCLLQLLYKQILSDRNSTSFRFDTIANDGELCSVISDTVGVKDGQLFGYTIDPKTHRRDKTNITKQYNDACDAMEHADPEQLFVSMKEINRISQHYFGERNWLRQALRYYYDSAIDILQPVLSDKQQEQQEKRRETWMKQAHRSFNDIYAAAKTYVALPADSGEFSLNDKQTDIAATQFLHSYFRTLPIAIEQSDEPSDATHNDDTSHLSSDILSDIIARYRDVHDILTQYKDTTEHELQQENNYHKVHCIKEFLDAIRSLFRVVKTFALMDRSDSTVAHTYHKDAGFYQPCQALYDNLRPIIALYNQTRNYLTQKPNRTTKYKLNFNCQTLADGWSHSKEMANLSVLLRKDGAYYLGIMHQHHEHKKIFEEYDGSEVVGDYYEKMVLLSVGKIEQNIHTIVPINDINEYESKKMNELKRLRKQYIPHIDKIKVNETYKGASLNKEDLKIFIDYYKTAAQNYWSWANFSFRDSADYKTFPEFTDHVKQQGYKISFNQKISVDYINECISSGKLYLFKIACKDFSQRSKGKKNLHTLYWNALFSPENAANPIYRLSGNAELFFRKQSITYGQKIMKHGHHADDPNKKQPYPIIKDYRYTQDTFLFHVPITANVQAGSNEGRFNSQVRAFLKQHPSINIIGIDRGERHLAYYTVIDSNGAILKQESLNVIKSKGVKGTKDKEVDYNALLSKRAQDRDDARKNWGTITSIKNLKNGYISAVVHEIVSLMLKYNAIVVLEDLNFGFKRGRFKIEKQIYQALEKALIDKLNYVVQKEYADGVPGDVMNALQLTAPFESFTKMGKQTGFLFYVPAYHTSKVCPATGFVNLLYPKYDGVEQARKFLKNFDTIFYNTTDNYFEFHFCYAQFGMTDKKHSDIWNKQWQLCTHGDRIKQTGRLNHYKSVPIDDLTAKYRALFDKHNITFEHGKCIKDAIIKVENARFFKELIQLLKLTLQMRNTDGDNDYMISPVKDSNGNFFDSRVAGVDMPKNADANGAYHIALKGLCYMNQLRSCPSDKLSTWRPQLKNEDWYRFIQHQLRS